MLIDSALEVLHATLINSGVAFLHHVASYYWAVKNNFKNGVQELDFLTRTQHPLKISPFYPLVKKYGNI